MLAYMLIALSTFASEDLACIGTGILVAQHQLGFLAGAGACTFGIFTGDLLLVLAGRSARFARLRARAAFLSGNTGWKLAATRFTPGLRLPIYVAAGLSRIPIRKVVPPLLIGAAIWTPLLVGATDWLGGTLVAKGLKALELAVAAGVAVKLAAHYRIFSYEKRRIIAAVVHRIFRWEFWPAWVAYVPLVPYILWLGVRYRSLTLFTAANPGIATGGLVGESKASILRHFRAEPDLAARWMLLPAGIEVRERQEMLRRFMEREHLNFPLVLKPDVGERGSGVAIVHTSDEAEAYLRASAGADVIAQEYVSGPEFGVFYRRYPWEETGRVISITAKILPELTGDGRRDLKQLILSDARAFCLHRTYLAAARQEPSYVAAEGERVRLVEIGSHCRGAIFLDAMQLCTPALEDAVERISRSHPGFFFGRFDVRSESVDAFQQGRFKVLELNGVGSEPTHVYDPAIGVFRKYEILAKHWEDMFEIGASTRSAGIEPWSIAELWRAYQTRVTPEAIPTHR
jgi:membrane protein DedA with SNARE-associated domain